jgi:putative component of toxin-antitoxin plasmid stabilization module
MIELRGYIDEKGNKRFALWLAALDAPAAAKVTIVLTRMERGNFSKVKGVGAGVYDAAQECWADYKRRKKQETQ